MRPIRKTVSSQTASVVIALDHFRDPFNVTLGVTLAPASTLTYNVEYTLDDVFDNSFNPATATWVSVDTLGAKTASAQGNLAFPVTGVRLNVTAYTAGSATLTVIQAGLVN